GSRNTLPVASEDGHKHVRRSRMHFTIRDNRVARLCPGLGSAGDETCNQMNTLKSRFCFAGSVIRIVSLALLLIVGLYPTTGSAEQISLKREHGIYMVPVLINPAVRIPFVLDKGAAEVAIPADVFMTLLRSHSVAENDFLGNGSFITADGIKHESQQFILRE